MKRLLHGFLAFTALSILGCATAFTSMESPDINVINIEPLEAEGIFEQRARVDLRIINPNDVDLSVTGFSFHLDINDTRFTRGVSNQAVLVPRLGEAKASVVVTSTMLDVARLLMAMDQQKKPTYLIQGKVYLSGARASSVSFEHSGDLLPEK